MDRYAVQGKKWRAWITVARADNLAWAQRRYEELLAAAQKGEGPYNELRLIEVLRHAG